jgi:hypothetical protein
MISSFCRARRPREPDDRAARFATLAHHIEERASPTNGQFSFAMLFSSLANSRFANSIKRLIDAQ